MTTDSPATTIEQQLSAVTAGLIEARLKEEEAFLRELIDSGKCVPGEWSRVIFRHSPDLLVVAPNDVIAAVERGERTLTVEEAMAECPWKWFEATAHGPSALRKYYSAWRRHQDFMEFCGRWV